jgi:hypothetical protein
MLRVDWQRFGGSVRAQAVVDAARYSEIEKRLGISHARLINAAQGKPVGTEIFLTLCHWTQQDPLWFTTDAPDLPSQGDK